MIEKENTSNAKGTCTMSSMQRNDIAKRTGRKKKMFSAMACSHVKRKVYCTFILKDFLCQVLINSNVQKHVI